jgi:hypothetical protein
MPRNAPSAPIPEAPALSLARAADVVSRALAVRAADTTPDSSSGADARFPDGSPRRARRSVRTSAVRRGRSTLAGAPRTRRPLGWLPVAIHAAIAPLRPRTADGAPIPRTPPHARGGARRGRALVGPSAPMPPRSRALTSGRGGRPLQTSPAAPARLRGRCDGVEGAPGLEAGVRGSLGAVQSPAPGRTAFAAHEPRKGAAP